MKERVEKVRAALEEKEAALITSGANRFYLTGFASSAGFSARRLATPFT